MHEGSLLSASSPALAMCCLFGSVWGDVSLWFKCALPWGLFTLSTFSYALVHLDVISKKKKSIHVFCPVFNWVIWGFFVCLLLFSCEIRAFSVWKFWELSENFLRNSVLYFLKMVFKKWHCENILISVIFKITDTLRIFDVNGNNPVILCFFK